MDRETSSRLGTPQVPESSQAWGTSDKQVRVVVGAEFSALAMMTKPSYGLGSRQKNFRGLEVSPELREGPSGGWGWWD